MKKLLIKINSHLIKEKKTIKNRNEIFIFNRPK